MTAAILCYCVRIATAAAQQQFESGELDLLESLAGCESVNCLALKNYAIINYFASFVALNTLYDITLLQN